MCASEGAVNLADQLHVVEESVEGVKVREAHHVGDAASCSLQKHPTNGSRHVLITRYVTLFSFKMTPQNGDSPKPDFPLQKVSACAA